ncbi:helix-turn-helix transcriptional regulator [Nanchangia anserum]|uniref:AraC family transcriptional regulator n=1 Tax=Nanchangia anserum TaxID=2692125 RepID=UPI001883E587|nr:helix-turn-helix domain-containing protein [Nanchangia anserum]QOX81315.1 helix-turn-helix transcriptional regulator [Nanchangia anserum]
MPRRDIAVHIAQNFFRDLATLAPDLTELAEFIDRGRQGFVFSGATAHAGADLLRTMPATRGTERFLTLLELVSILAHAPDGECTLIDPEGGAALSDDDDMLYTAALDYMLTHLREPLRLSDLAAHLALSESSVSRLLTRATTCGFTHTLNRLRLIEACRLLRTTDSPVSEICYASGFTSLSNFNRRFREYAGVTPRTYRRSFTLAGA